MANTHDYSLANDTGANFRADLNTLLGEVQASNIGGSAPSQAVTGKLWYVRGLLLFLQLEKLLQWRLFSVLK